MSFFVVALALVADWVFSWRWWAKLRIQLQLFRRWRIPHPVEAFGLIIGLADRVLNRPRVPPQAGWRQTLIICWLRAAGVGLVIVLGTLALAAGWAFEEVIAARAELLVRAIADSVFVFHTPVGESGWVEAIGRGLVILSHALLLGWLIAGRALHDAIADVASALRSAPTTTVEPLPEAQQLLSGLVGRNTHVLDTAGVQRTAIETLFENLNDGVVATLFWYLVLGMPGALLHKAISTSDSMVGYRSIRYRQFGWASARVDDVLAFGGAVATVLLLVGCSGWRQLRRLGGVLSAILGQAYASSSVNAVLCEAAAGFALGVRLRGPVVYADASKTPKESNWVGELNATSLPQALLARALRLYRRTLLVMMLSMLLLGFVVA